MTFGRSAWPNVGWAQGPAGWDPRPEILAALRWALDDPDGYTRSVAAASLGHLGDLDAGTWSGVLALVEQVNSDARELGTALVLLARLDPADRRASGKQALERLAELHPAWTRDLRAFADQLA